MAAELGLRPSKALGQNFVVDANTVRRIARLAEVGPHDVVLEVGPGLGSLTLALLARGGRVVAVEIDRRLAARLPRTVADLQPGSTPRLTVLTEDAGRVQDLPWLPTALVANLPYNVAVPVLLHCLARFPSLGRGVVMVQAEVADRLAARPGTTAYGVPSVKLAWFAEARRVGTVAASVFWPVPRVGSGLVSLTAVDPPATRLPRSEVFATVDRAFSQRRKMLRSSLAFLAGGHRAAVDVLTVAGVRPDARPEQLGLAQFVAIAEALRAGDGSRSSRGTP